MSNPIGDPGHGHSPAAWTAIVIMLVGGHDRHLLLLPRRAGPGLGLGRARRGRPARRLGHEEGRLRRQRVEVRAERALSMLADLTAGAVEDAEARASLRPLAAVESAALARPAALRCPGGARPVRSGEDHRRGQAREPLARRPGRDPRPGPAGTAATSRAAPRRSRVLTEGRRFKGSLADLEAVRDAVSPSGAAQGLHRDRVPGARGAGIRRRPRAADRGGPRAGRARATARAHPRARHDRRWSRRTPPTRSIAPPTSARG